MTIIPPSYSDIYTLADVEEAERDLAAVMAERDATDDPDWRTALDAFVADDTAWLAEMMEMIEPMLPMAMPLAPAPERRLSL